jgi:hypothetical protein
VRVITAKISERVWKLLYFSVCKFNVHVIFPVWFMTDIQPNLFCLRWHNFINLCYAYQNIQGAWHTGHNYQPTVRSTASSAAKSAVPNTSADRDASLVKHAWICASTAFAAAIIVAASSEANTPCANFQLAMT